VVVLLLVNRAKTINISICIFVLMVHFKAKIWRSGSSFVVTVPSDFVNAGLFPAGSLVDVTIKKNMEDEKDG